jgi:4-amino-4-deoxy-L-arabinose transferase-like glycosyltransferase
MLLNAALGALAAVAVHRLLQESGRRWAAVAALGVALHPGLVLYTPALMTEGVTAALWVAAVWASQRAAEGRRGFVVLAGVLLGVATLVRPQTVAMAPVVGWLCAAPRNGLRGRMAHAVLVTVLAVLTCAPWTLRNCERMGHCAFVSVNGGWNLLIGTQSEGAGAWSELRVPEACRTVYDEAGKDACFGDAARERIRHDPWAWLALTPSKLHATFDYCGAGPWYLHEANADAFGDRAKLWLGTVETAYERIVLLLLLVGAWASGGRQRWRTLVFGVALVFLCQRHATPAYLGAAVLLVWREQRHVVDVMAAAVIVLVATVHGVFFGAGRYQLVIWPLMVAAMAVHGEAGTRRLKGALVWWSRRRRVDG